MLRNTLGVRESASTDWEKGTAPVCTFSLSFRCIWLQQLYSSLNETSLSDEKAPAVSVPFNMTGLIVVAELILPVRRRRVQDLEVCTQRHTRIIKS